MKRNKFEKGDLVKCGHGTYYFMRVHSLDPRFALIRNAYEEYDIKHVAISQLTLISKSEIQMNPQPQQEMNDQELIKDCETIIEFTQSKIITELLNRFKSLTQDRSELVEKCVEAVMNESEYSNFPQLTSIHKLRTALKSILTPEKK